jgi:Clp protease
MTSVTAPLLDLDSRILSLLGNVGSEEVNLLIDFLLRADEKNAKEITLYVSSKGGDVIEGLKLIDTLRLLRAPVTAVCFGQVEGAGVILLAACAKRVLFSSALLSTGGLWALPQIHHENRHPIGIHGQVDVRQILLAKVKKQVEQAIVAMPGKIPSFLADATLPPRLFDAQETMPTVVRASFGIYRQIHA